MNDKAEYKNYKEWIFRGLSHYKFRIIISMLIVVIRGIILLLPSIVTQQIIDVVLPKGSFSLLFIYAVLLVAIPITVSVLIIVDLFIDKYILQFMSKLRCDIYNGLQYRPLQWIKETKLGDVINCMLDETEDVTNFGYFGIGSIIWFNTTIIAGLGLMFTRNFVITISLLLVILFQTFITTVIGEKHKMNSQMLINSEVKFTNRVLETISGIQFIKSTASESLEYDIISRLQDEKYEVLMKQRKLDFCRNISTAAFVILTNFVIYMGGGILVLRGEMTIGALVAINSLFVWIQPAIFGYQSMYINTKRIAPSLERIYRMLYPVVNKEKGIVPSEVIDIKGENISFRYDKRIVLDHFDFEISKGECISIVGPSGTGKSTLVNIMLGLENPLSGKVTINGIDLNSVDKKWIRENVICVPQNAILRSESILDNILYNMERVSDEHIQEVLNIVCLKDWIDLLPDGIHTLIGEHALKISGGERQRICIARALIRKPQILILDEATSGLDSITEKRVILNIKEYLPNTILLFVTHRQSLLSLTDKVIQI